MPAHDPLRTCRTGTLHLNTVEAMQAERAARQRAAMAELADHLDRIERELAELQQDAAAHHLHMAEERISRMRAAATTTAKGLRIQAAKQRASSP